MKIKQILLPVYLLIVSFSVFAGDFYKTSSAVSVREGAGKNYPVSFTLQKGEEVEVLSKTVSWYQIRYGGQTGYVYSKYLRYSRPPISETPNTQENQREALPFLIIAGLVLITSFYIYTEIKKRQTIKTVTQFSRGTSSERKLVLTLLRSGMPADTVFHDLYVKKDDGGFSQIDLVAVTDVGIIVFEVKEYSGWLYGNGKQQQWMQVLAYGKSKYRFYNPILQNNSHVTALRKKLTGNGNHPYFSVVVFYGDCVFKDLNFVPAGAFLTKANKVLDVIRIIFNENNPVQYSSKETILNTLQEAVVNGSKENQVLHKAKIKDMLGKHRIFE